MSLKQKALTVNQALARYLSIRTVLLYQIISEMRAASLTKDINPCLICGVKVKALV